MLILKRIYDSNEFTQRKHYVLSHFPLIKWVYGERIIQQGEKDVVYHQIQHGYIIYQHIHV